MIHPFNNYHITNLRFKAFQQLLYFRLIQDEQAATHLAEIAGLFAEQEEQPENVNSNKGDDLLAMMDDLWFYAIHAITW